MAPSHQRKNVVVGYQPIRAETPAAMAPDIPHLAVRTEVTVIGIVHIVDLTDTDPALSVVDVNISPGTTIHWFFERRPEDNSHWQYQDEAGHKILEDADHSTNQDTVANMPEELRPMLRGLRDDQFIYAYHHQITGLPDGQPRHLTTIQVYEVNPDSHDRKWVGFRWLVK